MRNQTLFDSLIYVMSLYIMLKYYINTMSFRPKKNLTAKRAFDKTN